MDLTAPFLDAPHACAAVETAFLALEVRYPQLHSVGIRFYMCIAASGSPVLGEKGTAVAKKSSRGNVRAGVLPGIPFTSCLAVQIKNRGSFDTVGKYEASGIKAHVMEVLKAVPGANAEKHSSIKVDPHACFGTWWNPSETFEDNHDVECRTEDMFANVGLGCDAKALIFVGHSHFFRRLMQCYLSEEYEREEPEWTEKLKKQRMGNCACLRIQLEWEAPMEGVGVDGEFHCDLMEPPMITRVTPMFGSALKGDAPRQQRFHRERPPQSLPELPAGWESLSDPQGRQYYHHRPSGKTQWEPPGDLGEEDQPGESPPADLSAISPVRSRRNRGAGGALSAEIR